MDNSISSFEIKVCACLYTIVEEILPTERQPDRLLRDLIAAGTKNPVEHAKNVKISIRFDGFISRLAHVTTNSKMNSIAGKHSISLVNAHTHILGKVYGYM